MGRTANLLMSTWVWLPPGWTWTAMVQHSTFRYNLIFHKTTTFPWTEPDLTWTCSVLTWPDLTWPLHTGVLSLALWLKMSWRDHRLAWDPQYYEDINVIRLVASGHLTPHTSHLSNSQFHLESPPIPYGSRTLHFSINKTFLMVSWPRTSRVPTPTCSCSLMGTFSGFLPSSTVFCARGSPTVTGPGELRCATSALVLGPTTPRTISFSSMKIW